MNTLCFQILQLPDLTLNKYQSLANTGINGVLKRHESFLRQWHGICQESETSFHLLYTYSPEKTLGSRLGLYFILQGKEEHLKLVAPLLKDSPLSDFYDFVPSEIPDMSYQAAATLTKKERIAEIPNPMTNQMMPFHYVPEWTMNPTARLVDLLRLMKTVSESYTPETSCAFRIDLYPADDAIITRERLTPLLKTLRGDYDIKLIRDTDSLRSDDYGREISKSYEKWLENIETAPHFRVNMYAFSNNLFKSKILLNAAGSESISEGDFTITPIKADYNGAYTNLSRLTSQPQSYCRSVKPSMDSWATTYCLSEIVPFFRFPVLYDGETLEIPKETAPTLDSQGVYLGKDTNNYPVYFPLQYLSRHAFFTGMPGSGKTNTMLHLVTELRKQNVPFLALEPAKKEYRALLADPSMRDVHLFSPHLSSRFPLQMNPLQFPLGVQLSEHINALLQVFQGTFELQGATYHFLSKSIQNAYTNKGWDIEDVYTKDCEHEFPTLKDVYQLLEKEINESKYEGDIKGNLTSFLQVRLGGLMERDAGELFNVHYSTLQPEEWLTESAIVELEVLGEQAKNFFVLMICNYIFETLRANPKGGKDSKGNLLPLRHVLFIEEAHNIIAPESQQASADTVNPKVSATAYIVKMLAEVRALREGIVIADQLPTALTSEVTKNTGLKLVHRLTSKDDREVIGNAISASPIQLERMASFTSGRAYIHHEKTLKPFEIQIAEWKSPKVRFDISDDEQLYKQLCTHPNLAYAVSISLQNKFVKSLDELQDKLDQLSLRLVVLKKNDIAEETYCNNVKEEIILENEFLEKKLTRYNKLWNLQHDITPDLHLDFESVQEVIDSINDRANAIKVK